MIKVRLLDPGAIPPTVAHPGSDLGFDLYALEDTVLHPGIVAKVRTGIAVEGPEGYGFVLGDRSSMAAKGITYVGGRIDAGYRGEILVCLVNVNQPRVELEVSRDAKGCVSDVRLALADVAVTLRKGDKIAQMSLFRAQTEHAICVVEELGVSVRAEKGFGSTGR